MDPTVKQGIREVDKVMEDKSLSIEDKKLTLHNMINIYRNSGEIISHIEKFLNKKISNQSNLEVKTFSRKS